MESTNTKSQQARRLHLGRLKDWHENAPVNIDSKGLAAHMAIIAQSGSGKSFMLGRLLEEIVSKTQARAIIFDPNSDFVTFSEVNEDEWKKDAKRSADKKLFDETDTLEEFKRRWDPVGFHVFSNRHPAPTLHHPKANSSWISPSWSSLSWHEQLDLLGINARLQPQAFTLAENWAKLFAGQSFAAFAERIESLPASNDERRSVVLGAVRELQRLDLKFDMTSQDGSINKRPGAIGSGKATERVVTVDVGSMNRRDEQCLAARIVLEGIWKAATVQWTDAMNKPPEDDTRVPCFVVIDEAHNLAPAEPRTELAKSVNDLLVRIATEGRKFGLFLILVTQRPSRLDPGILSQCDNLCLMKMNNYADVELVQEGFGFLPPGYAKRAMEFKVGDALLAGSLGSPIFAHMALRRTVAGGRNLRDDHWTQDPYLAP
jgi:uncharacterized protein